MISSVITAVQGPAKNSPVATWPVVRGDYKVFTP